MLRVYLVVSYDDDQQQWFYDSVQAPGEDEAESFIRELRPYVIAADATASNDLLNFACLRNNNYTFDTRKGVAAYPEYA